MSGSFFIHRQEDIPELGQHVDVSHPQLQDCVHWWPMVNGQSFIHDVINDANGAAIANWTRGEDGWKVDDAVGGLRLVNKLNPTLGSSSAFALSFWAKHSATAAYKYALSLNWSGDLGGSAHLFSVRPMDDVGGIGPAAFLTGAQVFKNVSGIGYADSKWHHFVYSQLSSTQRFMYVDGVSLSGAWGGSKNTSTVDSIIIGAWQGASFQFEGWLRDIRVYNRFLDEGRIVDLHRHEWAPFDQRIWVPVNLIPEITNGVVVSDQQIAVLKTEQSIVNTLSITDEQQSFIFEPISEEFVLDDAFDSTVTAAAGLGHLVIDSAVVMPAMKAKPRLN